MARWGIGNRSKGQDECSKQRNMEGGIDKRVETIEERNKEFKRTNGETKEKGNRRKRNWDRARRRNVKSGKGKEKGKK